MRVFFATAGAVIAVAAAGTWLSLPESAAGKPVLHWVTDPAPSRAEQIEAFYGWMRARGDVDTQGSPAAALRIDANNGDQDKIMIQGVAGVAGDLIDTRSGDQLRLFNSLGILTDVTDDARAGGFATADTWPATEPDLAVDGRQFAFPCNVTTRELWVNKSVFERLGQPLPTARWTFDEFEAAGRAFIAAARASPGGSGGPTFFCDDVPLETMYRSLGLGLFNETMTACDLDDPRYVEVLRRKHRWIYEERLMPSPEDRASMTASSGFGSLSAHLFRNGRLGLFFSGRYMLLAFRQAAEQDGRPLSLGVVGLPHGGFPNSRALARSAAVYKGSANPALAKRFVEYLASDAYNRTIVESGDALPPVPRYTQDEAYLRPPKWPNEWGCHEAFAEAMRTLAIGGEFSPFILATDVDRIALRFVDEFDNGLIAAEDAARRTTRAVDAGIAQYLRDHPELARRHGELSALQAKIDATLAAGERVPAEWVSNPFYRRYYAATGRLLPAGGEAR